MTPVHLINQISSGRFNPQRNETTAPSIALDFCFSNRTPCRESDPLIHKILQYADDLLFISQPQFWINHSKINQILDKSIGRLQNLPFRTSPEKTQRATPPY